MSDTYHVEYHSTLWNILVESGYVTVEVYWDHGRKIAYMLKERKT